ncbi:hypothetical protein [Allohahella marinimesophila]|uniref:GIY-YIG domain-containing protein n=1 Tax=Allohahella marinimesophila TaxID=1054972 RepID=A0ABP7Q7Y8_9GAMM
MQMDLLTPQTPETAQNKFETPPAVAVGITAEAVEELAFEMINKQAGDIGLALEQKLKEGSPAHKLVTPQDESISLTRFLIPSVGELPVYQYPKIVKNSRLALRKRSDYYLYILFKPGVDGGSPTPFYVGIGQNRRFAYHYSEADNPSYLEACCNLYKYNTIQKIGRDRVLIQLFNLDKEKAKELEKRLIKHWGRRAFDPERGLLTNLTSGGEGVSGIPMPPHVLKKLSEAARTRIKFNGKIYDAIKSAFEAHSADELAAIFSQALGRVLSSSQTRCSSYAGVKQLFHSWKKFGAFPEGFNYVDEDGADLYQEATVEVLNRIKRSNIEAGTRQAWKTKYPFDKYRTPWGNYPTLRAAAEDSNISTENLVRKFNLMDERDHFDPGFNKLDEAGAPLFKEQIATLQEDGRLRSAKWLVKTVSKPMLVDGQLVGSRREAWHLYPYLSCSYESFCQYIERYKTKGLFPEGLNVSEAEGGPYPEFDRTFLASPLSHTYVKVCGRLYPSLQAASVSLGMPNQNSLWTIFKAFKERYEAGIPFPKGFNSYQTIGDKPHYEEQNRVCKYTPKSGILYEHRFYKTSAEASRASGKRSKTVATYINKRRRLFFEKGIAMDAGMNVCGLDGKLLYPIEVGVLATSILTTTGRPILSNAAKTIYVSCNGRWKAFTPIAQAWREVQWIADQYKSPDSFRSSIRSQLLDGKLDPRVRFDMEQTRKLAGSKELLCR